MDNHFNSILNIFKRLDEAVTASSISSPHGPAAVAGAQRGGFAGMNAAHGDRDDKENLAAYQIKIMNKQTELEMTKKLGGIPPKFGKDGTGIFSGMDARDFPKWLDAHPQYVDAILGITGTNNKAPAAAIPPSQQVAQNQQSQKVNVPPVPTAGQTTMSDYKSTLEGTMSDAEHHTSGSRFGGYWKGTDKGTPRPGQGVGGTAESTEQRIRNKYNQYLKEMGTIGAVGMSTGGSTGTQDPAAAQKTQQELNGVKKELDTAKAKKLLPQNTNTQQAAQGLAALQQAGGDMNKVPGNLKQKIAPVISGIAGALGAGAKNPQQTNKVTQGLGMLGGAAATLE